MGASCCTGLDFDGRDFVDEVLKVGQVEDLGHTLDAPVERGVGGEEHERFGGR